MKTAVIIGATGLTGQHLTHLLLQHPAYHTVKVLVRGDFAIQHPKLHVYKTNMQDEAQLRVQLTGDDLFCCIGTTIRKAGSQAAFRAVDYDIPVTAARIAAQNGMKQLFVVSSLGANIHSSNFYLRTKGEMEHDVQHAGVPVTVCVRPSMLLGERKELRVGERIGQWLIRALAPLLQGSWRKYRGIQAQQVAKAMVYLAQHSSHNQVVESDELERLGNLV
jgi:uncharacterized protein YbjT (DUF2867 family)